MGLASAGRPLKQRLHRAVPRLWMPVLAMAAAQQAAVPLERLEVALWPEFDRPSVLVIYRYQLSAVAALPASLALPIPPEVSELHALAYLGPSGDLLNIEDYVIRPGEGWSTAEFSSPGRQGQLEFYAGLAMSGDQRSFRFDWPGGVALSSLGFEVQQPPTASEFSVTPAPSSQAVGQNGLNHYFGSLQTAGGASLVVSYRKEDDRLSIDSLPVSQPPSALGQPSAPPAGGLDLQSALPWVLGGLGLVLLGAGVIWYLRLSRPAPAEAPPARRSVRGREGAETEASPIYCHQCGSRAGSSDVYCRQCGTKLRGR